MASTLNSKVSHRDQLDRLDEGMGPALRDLGRSGAEGFGRCCPALRKKGV